MNMKKPPSPRFAEYAKIFEFVRHKNETPAQQKRQRYSFEPARRPDMMLAPRPRADLRAADLAIHEIREYASKAREVYKSRLRNERPAEARDYVRAQLSLGLLDTPTRKPINGDFRFEDLDKRLAPPEKPARSMLGFLRKGRPKN